ncbi:MAG: tryptophan-rich sensory protein [Coleofasciculus sp. D1-CHI-01]|uniref:tryptophan-rich sensory protein n=1 Tax=Coleofasciculus sp. D1-CHI-01 TaxID=3068482 RepID=UPI0032F5C9B7
MNKKVKNLFTSIGICVFFGIIGGWLTGDALETWFKQINQPWYSLPLTGWYSVGCLYYLMIIVILYRLLNEGGKFKASLLAGERFGERFSRAREK